MSPALLSTACAGLVLAVGFGLGSSPAAVVADDATVAAKRAAAAPLATMRHDTVASLIAQLDSPVPAARALVACALAERKADAAPAVASLVALLDDDAPVSPYVCREEWWMNDDEPDVAGRWHPVEPTTPGQEAARALSRIGTIAFDPVLRVLPGGGGHARRNAAWILGALRDERAVSPLVAQLGDPLATVREHVVWALGAIRDERAVDPLARVVGQDDSADVRRQSAWALGAIRDGRAVDALLRALKDRDHGVRKQSAWALGAIRDARAIDGLAGVHGRQPERGAQAGRVGDGRDRQRARRHRPHGGARGQGRRRPAPGGVGARGDPRRAGGRAAAARPQGSGERRRKQVAWALGAIRDGRAVDGLIAALKDTHGAVRKQVAWALGAIGDGRATDGLTAALQDTDADVRKQAAWALGVVVRRQ